MKPNDHTSRFRTPVLSLCLLLLLGATSKVSAEVCLVCYDGYKAVSNGIHFCTTPSGEECGNNIIIDGNIAATGYQTVNGCGAFWGNPHHTDCSGTRVGPCK